jgi:protein-S-isoprenylcysteine O-methyltransferase Ste14
MAVFIPGTMTWTRWAIGAAVIVLGEVVRLAGVAAAGPGTRRRSRVVPHLVTDGPFACVRNPLYIGNALAWAGIACISGVSWLLPVTIAAFAAEYSFIVRYEEGVLESLFGEAYLAYKGRTPRWIPRPPGSGPRAVGREFDWRGAWRSESSTFVNIGVALGALLIKATL